MLSTVPEPAATAGLGNVGELARFTASHGNVERVDVLPFHTLGAAKYAALGLDYPCAEVIPPAALGKKGVVGQPTPRPKPTPERRSFHPTSPTPWFPVSIVAATYSIDSLRRRNDGIRSRASAAGYAPFAGIAGREGRVLRARVK